jgi:hypothetical protein
MNVFILEDDMNRYKMMTGIIRDAFGQCTFCMSSDVGYAKMLLNLGSPDGTPWDLICLDHDLGNEIYVDSDKPNTGYQLAKFISEQKILYKKCIIHSMNFAGATKMQAVLKDAAYLPITVWTPENLKYVVNS